MQYAKMNAVPRVDDPDLNRALQGLDNELSKIARVLNFADFKGLVDTPSSYAGEGGKNVRVNVGETALEFVTPGAPGIHATEHEVGGSDVIDGILSLTQLNLLNTSKIDYDDRSIFQAFSSSPDRGMKYYARGNAASWYGVHQFYTEVDDGADVLTMTLKAGKVGIGTASPVATQHISTASDGIKQLIQTYNSTIGQYTGILFKVSGNAADLYQKAGILFERTGSNGVGELHLAVNGAVDDTNATLSDAKLTVDGAGLVTLAGNLIVGGVGDGVITGGGNLNLIAGGGTGNVVLSAPSSGIPSCDTMVNNSVTFEIAEGGNNLYFRVKYSDGTLKSGSIALT